MSIKEIVVGGVITVVIGGTTYTVNQADVVTNFASDTGLTQQEAAQYVESVGEDDLVSYTVLGTGHITEGEATLAMANEIDCVTYEYEWQSATLSCEQGKAHLIKTGNDEVVLGTSFKRLDTASAAETDISATMGHIDTLNVDLTHEVITRIYEPVAIDESKKTNSYNKSLLKASLESTNKQ